jgi:DNA invertase Pin-like site-specific DNA recombinase
VKALGYVRCSTAEQAVEGMSLAVQKGRIIAWGEAMGAHLLDVIEDAGVSGARPLADRPGGARIKSLLATRNPNVDTVVVARLDRLGRDAAETLSYLRQFAQGSVGLVSIADRIDLGTPQGRAMAQMSAVFAELERALIAQRTSEALSELRSNGRVYGPEPYGFRRDGERLVVHDKERCVVSRMRKLRARGKSYDAIACALNRSGVPAKRGGSWHAMSVRSVLLTAPKIGPIKGEAGS